MSDPFLIMKRLGLKCSGVLQVGASFGQEVEAIANSGASVAVLVEALQQPYAALAEKIRGRPGLIAVKCLCSDTTGTTVRFKVATNKGMSSSILEPASHLDIAPSVRFPREIELQTVTVDDLFADLTRTSGRSFAMINTMMLDVQGAEHLVLRGASRTLKHVEHIYSEVSLGGLYKGDMPLEAFQQFMSERGFQMIWMELGRYGWGDALFTRRTSFAAASFNGQGS